jgi:hypothetical protein
MSLVGVIWIVLLPKIGKRAFGNGMIRIHDDTKEI